MKVLTAALAALLLVAICSPSEADLDISPVNCCFTYMRRPVAQRLIISVYKTSSQCFQPAVIMVTKKGRMICTDPQEPWVKNYLKYFQTLKTLPTETPAQQA